MICCITRELVSLVNLYELDECYAAPAVVCSEKGCVHRAIFPTQMGV